MVSNVAGRWSDGQGRVSVASMRTASLAALLPLLGAPDFLLPGQKGVRHELILTWDEADLPYRFVASPTHGFHGNTPIRSGEPFRFSSKYGTHILAAPLAAELPPAKERIRDVDWPSAPVPVREVRSIGAGHPLARVETTLRVARVDGGTIVFEKVGERRLDQNGRELGDLDWLPLALIAAGGAFWSWRLDRARRRPPENA